MVIAEVFFTVHLEIICPWNIFTWIYIVILWEAVVLEAAER